MAAVTLTPRNHLEAVHEVSPAEALDMTKMVNYLRSRQEGVDGVIKKVRVLRIAVFVAVLAVTIFAAIVVHPIILAPFPFCALVLFAFFEGFDVRIVSRDPEEEPVLVPGREIFAGGPEVQKLGEIAEGIQSEEFQEFIKRYQLKPSKANISKLYELYKERKSIVQSRIDYFEGKRKYLPDFDRLFSQIRRAGGIVPSEGTRIQQDLAGRIDGRWVWQPLH